MYRNKTETGVQSTRHFEGSPESKRFSSEGVARAHSHLRKIQAGLSGEKRATSENNLWTGDNIVGETDECWDSQSDRGSASAGKSRRPSSIVSILNNDENTSECSGEHSTINSKKQEPLHPNMEGKGTESFELRRRKGAKQDGNSGNGDFIIEIPEEDPSSDNIGYLLNSSPNYVHTSFDFMYYCCVSSYKWDNMKNAESSRRQYAVSVIQKIVVCYVAIMATFTLFSVIKYFILVFFVKRTLSSFIDIGYFVTAGAFQLYVTYFLATRKDGISNTMKFWSEYESKAFVNNNSRPGNKIKWLPIVNGLVTIAFAALKPIVIEDSWEDLLWENSKSTAECIYLWTPEQARNATYIKQEYGTNLNGKTYFLGIFGLMSIFCFNLQVDCFRDLIIWIALVNKQHVLTFGRKIDENLLLKAKTAINFKIPDDNCWLMYRNLRDVNSHTNSIFDKMLIINHVYSFLTFSYFLTFVLNEQENPVVVMMVGYNTLKEIIPFLPARTASQENDRCRKWIQILPCETKRFRVGPTPLTREIMLLELDKEPLGLGSGQVHIDNEFLVSFLTLAASLFCFLFNLDKKDERVTRY